MIDINNIKYQIRDDESEEDYEIRIGSYHDEDHLSWLDIANIINKHTDKNYSESRYRKGYKMYLKGKQEILKEEEEIPEISDLVNAKIELAKERIKISDERIQTNAYLRKIAREETIKEIAYKVASAMNSKKVLTAYDNPKDGTKEGILCISDWHYGIVCDNYWNKFSPEIATERISKLLQKTIKYCSANDVKKLHVVNIGDMIAGRIHLGLRLESRFDVITQTIQVSEILSEFLHALSEFFEVHYYHCLDNHSRLEPNKKDAMDLESLARIIPWYLRTRLNNIEIHENDFGEDIINFKAMNHEVIGVHGDKDKPTSVVDNLSMMTHKHYDMVLTAHLHHFSADEKNETVVVSNGSLLGTDTYAKNLRLSSKASQNLIIVSEDNVSECIYRIVLN